MSKVESRELRTGYAVSRIIKGNWQLSGDHGPVARDAAIDDLFKFVDAGITTFDCADIYTGVEDLLGRFYRRLVKERGSEAACGLRIHTKFVPDRTALSGVDRRYVERIIDRSISRLGVERLDLVQFHWWDYAIAGCFDAWGHLEDLQHAGKIAQLGVTNFDLAHVRQLQSAGRGMLSAQIQYSLLDRRPAGAFADFCRDNDIALFCYGVLAGGFITGRWLGQPDPGHEFSNRSLVKYRLIIDEFGGWERFQSLLRCLHAIAQRHGVSIEVIAMRALLEQSDVAAVIIGARYSAYLADNLRVFDIALDERDRGELAAFVDRAPGPAGEVYALERDRASVHARIMKYDLNDTPKASA